MCLLKDEQRAKTCKLNESKDSSQKVKGKLSADMCLEACQSGFFSGFFHIKLPAGIPTPAKDKVGSRPNLSSESRRHCRSTRNIRVKGSSMPLETEAQDLISECLFTRPASSFLDEAVPDEVVV